MDDDQKHPDQYEASLPLPIEDEEAARIKHQEESANPAADLIRKRIEAVYAKEPSARTEAADIKKVGSSAKRSKHQQFIYDLTNSGRPLHEIQVAWHEYYAGLPDREKHGVWQEFYATHARASHLTSALPELIPAKDAAKQPIVPRHAGTIEGSRKSSLNKHLQRTRKKVGDVTSQASSKSNAFRSLAFGLGMGAIVLVIFLFSFFNERFIAPFIQPSRTVTNTPIISDQPVSSAPEVIIPKINVEVPVVYDVNTVNDDAIENALENGVVHYADTAMPGQDGNVVIVGHSSNNIFNPGKYKFAFVLLSRVGIGDTFYLQKDGKRYTYQVYKRQIVSPTDVSVLGPADKPATATLITCDPPGTSNNRLVVTAVQIDPAPTTNQAATVSAQTATTQSTIIPGNSPTLWSRFIKWLNY